jgi:hypothetical protein
LRKDHTNILCFREKAIKTKLMPSSHKKDVKNHVGKERKIHREKEKTRKSSFFLQEEKAAHGT